ncbi:MAG: (2Fe-2S) ferredoxin domain-containing protein [Cyanomargarita calcarea GSE-NOS-MK-12-04C]|jgi:(2Fe-2S) ferredoxin|uniref:(2Fe-2S) ferredoxin domain-containing protein n=1 Tax=Cyanomargarita calcarea GSE-NOS-MK-12-04C TaxID=2839659 RepID=A0A951QJD2_9CYAN|nr:(2Fe-2S) ferredoxin domain-containing protein [Cyanomargarita calcarea GSE-NOS-MK-12-04C]
MSNSRKTEVSQYCLEGRLLDLVIKDGHKLKGLLLQTSEGEYYVKLAKHLRFGFDWRLPKGTLLQVLGEKKLDLETGKVKFEAERVMAAQVDEGRDFTPTPQPLSSETSNVKPIKQTTILVCQKSDCMKRGGKGVCQALASALSDRGLEEQVTIKGTGCMKNCKAGPNVVMPDKTRYTHISAAQVPAIIDKHFEQQDESKQVKRPVTRQY